MARSWVKGVVETLRETGSHGLEWRARVPNRNGFSGESMPTRLDVLKLNAYFPLALERRAAHLDDVFRQHFRLIHETAWHITGNADDADDVVQNTFLQLMRGEQRIHLLENPAAYFRRAARNQALKVLRDRQRFEFVDETEAFERPADADPPLSEEKSKQLRDFIGSLKPVAALIMTRRYLEGLSNSEIARTLGKSRHVVEVTLYRLRKRLKKITEGEL
jgi:RNA polymerase sigma factor (sigma-70 family)